MNTRTKILISAALVILGAASRLLPHAWNLVPIGAIGVFAGSRLGRSYGMALPVIAMALSDISIGFYDWRMNVSVYLAMALSGLIGSLIRKTKRPVTIGSAALASSTAFFLLTNGAVWAFTPMYQKTLAGLISSYVAGIPFFRNAIVGDFWYTFALFGAFELACFLVARRKAASALYPKL